MAENGYSRTYGVSKPPAVKAPTKETDAEIREKQQRAVDLRRAGASFTEIAQALNYHDASGAKKAVESAIRRFEFEATKDMLLMDLARYDEYLKLATHRLRTSGDLNQIDRCMRIIERKHWLLGVTPATLAETKSDGTMQTKGGMNVVIASTERTFVRGMMVAVGMDPESEEGRAYLKQKGLDGDEEPSPTPKKKKNQAQGKKRLKKKNVDVSDKKPANVSASPVIDGAGKGIIEGQFSIVSNEKEAADRDFVRSRSVRTRDDEFVGDSVVALDAKRI